MARQTVEIDKKLWQKFQKMLVDLYGSAYGSKKREALNEALDLWLEVKTAVVSGKTVEEQIASLAPGRKISPIVLELLGEEETFLPFVEERNLLLEALRRRMR